MTDLDDLQVGTRLQKEKLLRVVGEAVEQGKMPPRRPGTARRRRRERVREFISPTREEIDAQRRILQRERQLQLNKEVGWLVGWLGR